MTTFGEHLKQTREEQNMTQQALAEKLYVTRQAVSRWERGARYPDLLTAQKLAFVLNISLNELLSGESLQDNIRKDTVMTYPVASIIQSVLYAIAAITYFMLCIFSLYSYINPSEALIGTPAGEITLLQICSDLFRLIHFIGTTIGLYLSVKNRLTVKLTGCIMCIPYFMAALSFLMTYIDIIKNQNGYLDITAWLTDFIVPLSFGVCILLFFNLKEYKVPFLLIVVICILTIVYYISGYRNRLLNFTDLGFVITTTHFIGKICMIALLGYQSFVWGKKRNVTSH